MKIFLRSFSFPLSLILLCVSLFSCSKKAEYSDDVPCSELMDSVEDQIPVNFGYETFGGEHLRYYFNDTELPDDSCLRYSVISEDINEVGIFHTPDDASREEVKRLCEQYIEQLREDQRAFIASYTAEELPKLDGAEVRSFGNYTVYAILSEDDRALAFDTVEKKLTENND